jgi:DMSO/TMAO reductase YedYZ heme-binding membrane subunit
MRRGTDTQIIFGFYWTLFQAMGRMKAGLEKKLKFSSMLILRLAMPILAYFFFVCHPLIYQHEKLTLGSHCGSHASKQSGRFPCRITSVEVCPIR